MEFFRHSSKYIHQTEIIIKKLAALVCVPAFCFLACHKKVPVEYQTGDTPSEKEVLSIYSLYKEGKYAAYVDKMASCQNMPSFYKKQMIMLFQQHAQEIRKSKKGVLKAEFITSELHDKGKMANVYMRITYGDGSKERIMLKFVNKGGEWLLR